MFALLAAWPRAAEACSVCFSTTDENRVAFIVTTIFLSAAPLAILFGIGSWLRRRILASEQAHDAARQAGASSAAEPTAPVARRA